MSRSASVPMVYEKGEIYFTPENNDSLRFRSIEKGEFFKFTPKLKIDEPLSLIGYTC